MENKKKVKPRDTSYHKYFTKVQLAKKFGYKDARSFMSSRARFDMWEGISFVIQRVESVKDEEINQLKCKLGELAK